MKIRFGMAGALIVLGGLAATGPAAAKVRPVVEAGLHYSTVDYDHDLAGVLTTIWDNGWRPSFTGGAYVEWPLGSRFRLSPGLRYVQKGNRAHVEQPGVLNGEFRLLQDYLAIPVLLQLRPFASPRVAFSLGPEVAYLLTAHAISETTVLGFPRTGYNDIRNEMDDFDVSIEAGVEYAFPLENHEGFMRLRYSEGLVGVADASQWLSDWSTRGIQTVLGLRW